MIDEDVYRRLRIAAADNVRDAALLLRELVWREARLHVAPAHNIASKEPMHDGDNEVLASSVFRIEGGDAWWQDAELALHSPITAACRLTAEPFWCNARGIYGAGPNALLAAIGLRDFAERAHTRAAIVVPVHLPFGQVAAASLLPDDPACEDLAAPFAEHADRLAIYIRRFLVSYVEVMQPKPRSPGAPVLRKREVECLRWAAVGKTNEEIASILGLSRATVRFHIRNASEKLDAVNRDQAVFKASQLGYLASVV